MKIIDKTVVSRKSPKHKDVLWIDSNDGTLKIPHKGEWKDVGGNGDGSSSGSNQKSEVIDEVLYLRN